MDYQQFLKLSTQGQDEYYNSLNCKEKTALNLASYQADGLGEEEKEFAAMIGKSEHDFLQEKISECKRAL